MSNDTKDDEPIYSPTSPSYQPRDYSEDGEKRDHVETRVKRDWSESDKRECGGETMDAREWSENDKREKRKMNEPTRPQSPAPSVEDGYDPAAPELKPQRSTPKRQKMEPKQKTVFSFVGDPFNPTNDVPRPVVRKKVYCYHGCPDAIMLFKLIPAYLLRQNEHEPPLVPNQDHSRPWFNTHVTCRACSYIFDVKVYIPDELYQYCTLVRYPPPKTKVTTQYSNGLPFLDVGWDREPNDMRPCRQLPQRRVYHREVNRYDARDSKQHDSDRRFGYQNEHRVSYPSQYSNPTQHYAPPPQQSYASPPHGYYNDYSRQQPRVIPAPKQYDSHRYNHQSSIPPPNY